MLVSNVKNHKSLKRCRNSKLFVFSTTQVAKSNIWFLLKSRLLFIWHTLGTFGFKVVWWSWTNDKERNYCFHIKMLSTLRFMFWLAKSRQTTTKQIFNPTATLVAVWDHQCSWTLSSQQEVSNLQSFNCNRKYLSPSIALLGLSSFVVYLKRSVDTCGFTLI